MKLLALKEASPHSTYPVSQEVFRRVRENGYHTNITQEDIGQFAAWLEVEFNGLGKNDLKRLIWEGIKGLKDDPNGVEKVFKEFVEIYTDDEVADGNDPNWAEDLHNEVMEELVSDFNRFKSGRKTR